MADIETLRRIENIDPVRNVPERIVPGHVRAQDLAEHLARYTWAATLLSGRVLDLGCGVGYGAQHCLSLNSDVREIVGADVNSDVVRYAHCTYNTRRLAFVGADGCQLPFSEGSFDAVLCFEVIEHVRNPNALLEEVRRVLRPEGILLVSTPNKLFSSPLLRRPLNPHHLQEWYPLQFVALLRRYFTVDTVYGQNWVSKGHLAPVLLNCCKVLLKIKLDRLGALDALRELYRGLHPFHRECRDPVVQNTPSAVLECSANRKRVPEVVLAVATHD